MIDYDDDYIDGLLEKIKLLEFEKIKIKKNFDNFKKKIFDKQKNVKIQLKSFSTNDFFSSVQNIH